MVVLAVWISVAIVCMSHHLVGAIIHFEPDCTQNYTFINNEPLFPWAMDSSHYQNVSEDLSLVPLNPRIFVEHSSYPFNGKTYDISLENIKVLFRWNSPSSRQRIESYRVSCSFSNQFGEAQYCRSPILENCTLHYETNDVPANSTVHLKVSACTASGCGPPTPPLDAHILFDNPVPELLISTRDGIVEMDFDMGLTHTLTPVLSAPPLMDYIYLENYLVFGLARQLTILSFDSMAIQWEFQLNGTITGLAVDWVGRYIYWAETITETSADTSVDLNTESRKTSGTDTPVLPSAGKSPSTDNSVDHKTETSGHHSTEKRNPSKDTSVHAGTKTRTTSVVNRLDLNSLKMEAVLLRNHTVTNLLVEPLQGMLIWLEEERNESTVYTSSLSGADVTKFFASHYNTDACSCHNDTRHMSLLAMDYMGRDASLLFVDAAGFELVSADLKACKCESLLRLGTNFQPSSITSDHKHIFWYQPEEGRIYSIRKFSDNIQDAVSLPMNHVTHIKSGSFHLQPFPDAHCLIPSNYIYTDIKLLRRSSHSIKLEMPQASVPPDCSQLSLPSLEYTLYYGLLENYADIEFNLCSGDNNCVKLTVFEPTVELTDLEPSKVYVFVVQIDNHYRRYLKAEPFYPPHVTFQTASEAPPTVKQVNVTLLTPHSVLIQWSPVQHNASLWYSVFCTSLAANFTKEKVVSSNSNLSLEIRKLSPHTQYQISIRVYAEDSISPSESKPVLVHTYPEPSNIRLVQRTPYSLTLRWDHNFLYRSCIMQLFNNQSWTNISASQLPDTSDDINKSTGDRYNLYHVTNLKPKTKYTFRLILVYNHSNSVQYWPQKFPFNLFETLGDRPRTPMPPTVAIHRVVWEAPSDNGDPITTYWLEAKSPDTNWTRCFTGPEPFWRIDSAYLQNTHRFRVRAYNAHGWSEFSEPSIQFDLSYQEPFTSFMAPFGVLSGTVIIFASLCTVCVLKCKKRGGGSKSKSKVQDYELAHLRCENLVEARNPMYMSSADYVPTDADIAALPKIKRDQITLTKFLGSGAFGEVFEGAARNLDETRVAVKTLRKGASPQEKIEFLKEALLMSNFKHEHILRLIGVCLDNNPTLIIMELMEGKDLLSYLRNHRPTKADPSCLDLKDLLSLSVDVARGCKYLEEMHFVHRDLAARNCLVSCEAKERRIVKIGDFGLARDIYRNDYYKKEGEGLLPVRWMAPECLVDGVFSTQSDVWAFGVLLWEIMSLGQQPYPARTNVDVLHYVRAGGRLNRPANCSHLMYSLMLKCWSFEADKRPSFKYCLQILDYLKSISKPLTLQVDAEYPAPQDASSPLHTELEFTFHGEEGGEGEMPGYLELLNMEAYYEIPRPYPPDPDELDDTISLDIEPETP